MSNERGDTPSRGKCKRCDRWITWGNKVTAKGARWIPFDELRVHAMNREGEDEQGRPIWRAVEKMNLYVSHQCPEAETGQPPQRRTASDDGLPF